MKRSVFVVLLALCAAGCYGPGRPPVVAPPSGPCYCTVSVFRGDPTGDHKVPGAAVVFTGSAGTVEGITDGAGNVDLVVSPGAWDVRVTASGLTTTAQPFTQSCGSALAISLPVPDPPTPAWRPLRGSIRLDGRVFVDDDGPRSSLGASLFWLGWGYRHDRERLDANLRWLAAREVDFVRAFAEVCGGSWTDREVRPDWPDYVDVIRGSTTLANTYGLRVEWTLFAGGCFETRDQWLAATDRIIEALAPVVHGVQFVEVTNEQQLPDSGVAREIAGRIRSRLGVPVALSGTPETGLPALYQGSAATVATVHFDRADGDFGWRSSRQSWGYWDLPSMPAAFVNNEPVGVASSVRAENDPVKLASDALVTWIAGGAAYVVHHGAGIYGRDYVHPTAGHRMANAWEQPVLVETLMILRNIRQIIPRDLPNWQRANNHWTAPNPVPPFRFDQDKLGDGATQDVGLARSFTTMRDDEFYTVALGARGSLLTTPTRSVTATVRELREWRESVWGGHLVGAGSTYLVHGR